MNSPNLWKTGDRAELSHTISEADVDAFVKLSGDDNPLHVDEGYARETLAGGRVVHGMLTASYVSTLIGTKIPGRGALWNRFSVNWKKMVRLGDSLDFHAEVTDVHHERLSLLISVKRGHEEVLTATADVELMSGTDSKESADVPAQLDQTSPTPNIKNTEAKPAILITGASGSIGTHLVRRLLGNGDSRLILWGRRTEDLLKLAPAESGHRVQSVSLDEPSSIEDALFHLKNESIKGIVHLAAPPLKALPASEASNQEDLDLHLQIGVRAFAKISQTLKPNMIEGCSLVALSTQYTLGMPPENTSAYVSAKCALEGYVRSLAVEWASQGIRSNLVAPSLINTPYARNLSPRMKMVEEARNPLKRLCHEDDVCDAIEHLLSPSSSFVNGSTLPLTGGLAR